MPGTRVPGSQHLPRFSTPVTVCASRSCTQTVQRNTNVTFVSNRYVRIQLNYVDLVLITLEVVDFHFATLLANPSALGFVEHVW